MEKIFISPAKGAIYAGIEYPAETVDQYALPPDIFSLATNVEFRQGIAQPIKGEYSNMHGTPSVAPKFMLGLYTATARYIIYSDTDKVYVVSGATHTNITRASGDYTGGDNDYWEGAFLNGIYVLTNGVDLPQLWNPIAPATALIDLTNWPSSTYCKTIRSFKNYLIAFNITKSSTNYPTLVKWSDVTSPGSVPGSWDETDATIDAGEFPLSDTPGSIQDALVLGDSMIIYKSTSVHAMRWVGGQDVFRFDNIDTSIGILTQGCVKEFKSGSHVFITHDLDIAVCNGQTVERITTFEVRSQLKTLLTGGSGNSVYRTRLAVDKTKRLVFIAIGRGTPTTYCQGLLVWNWEENTWTYWDTSKFYDIISIRDSFAAYDELPDSVLIGDYTNTKIKRLNYVNAGTINETTYERAMNRTQLSLVGVNDQGQYVNDPTVNKTIVAIWPIIKLASGVSTAEFTITVQTREKLSGTISSTAYTFDAAVDEKIDVFKEGKFFNIYISTTITSQWSFYGYFIEIDTTGQNT